MSEHYSANPSGTTDQWYVWNIYAGLPPKPVFFGSMEDAGLVADALNARDPSLISQKDSP